MAIRENRLNLRFPSSPSLQIFQVSNGLTRVQLLQEIMMNKKYVVKLTADERAQYERIVHTGQSAA